MVASADESWMQVAEAQHAGRVVAGDDRLHVTFNIEPVKDEEATARAGHPVYVDTEFIRKLVPGDKNNIVHRPVHPEDKKRFARQYEAFKQGREEGGEGMPLREWNACTRSEAEMLAYFKVLTVEHLAGLSDGAIQEIGPIRHLVEKAKTFIANAKAAAPAEQLAAALKQKDAEMEAMRRQLKELSERVEKQGRK
ncbi:hypothetical protein Mx9_p83 [Myxococcus phage Mx9]|nr:hypothetical protein Mx9_p83 [Myxococcus phage Mx9]